MILVNEPTKWRFSYSYRLWIINYLAVLLNLKGSSSDEMDGSPQISWPVSFLCFLHTSGLTVLGSLTFNVKLHRNVTESYQNVFFGTYLWMTPNVLQRYKCQSLQC